MNEQGEGLVGRKLQNAVKKLISEEYYAYQLYLLSKLAVKKEERGIVDRLLSEIAEDELNDHLKMLVEWCCEYNIEIPCVERDFKKFAAPKISRQVAALKKNQPVSYYLDEAMKSEESAIASYKMVLEMPEVHEFTDLQSALWKIFYDENEHLQNLKTGLIAYDANIDMII